MKLDNPLSAIALAVAAAVSAPAYADLCTGISLGTSQTGDFTLGSFASTACVISSVNPDQGPSGNAGGFSPNPFGTGWTLLAKMTSTTSPSTLGGVNYSWGITGVPGSGGTWSFGADQSLKLDLVIAMHGANRSGAFLFDDVTLAANQTQPGTWNINWVNNGERTPDYSNSSLWVRNVTAVPEPETYAMLLAGLGLLGAVARRKKKARTGD